MAKLTYRQNTVESVDGDIKTLPRMLGPVTFKSPKLVPNPYAELGHGNAFTAPKYVGINNSYSYVGTDGEVYEAEYVDPNRLKRDKDTGGYINKTKIALKDGLLVVPADSPGLYEFLHSHPSNGAFELRPSSEAARMVEIPIPETEGQKETRLALIQKAQVKVLGLSDSDVLDALDTLSLETSGGRAGRKDRLLSYARENAKAIMAIEKEETTLDLVEKAMDSKTIYFAGVNSTFNWNKSFEDKDNTLLVSKGGKDLEYLAEYFDDNKELLAQLKMRV